MQTPPGGTGQAGYVDDGIKWCVYICNDDYTVVYNTGVKPDPNAATCTGSGTGSGGGTP